MIPLPGSGPSAGNRAPLPPVVGDPNRVPRRAPAARPDQRQAPVFPEPQEIQGDHAARPGGFPAAGAVAIENCPGWMSGAGGAGGDPGRQGVGPEIGSRGQGEIIEPDPPRSAALPRGDDQLDCGDGVQDAAAPGSPGEGDLALAT